MQAIYDNQPILQVFPVTGQVALLTWYCSVQLQRYYIIVCKLHSCGSSYGNCMHALILGIYVQLRNLI